MGERPRRKRVRAEPLVHERQRRFDVRIGQVGKHRLNLVGRQHALVGERAGRQADHVEERFLRQRQGVDRVFEALADDIQLALEGRADLEPSSVERRPLWAAMKSDAAPRPMKICLKTGWTATADAPMRRLSVGTSRQPRTRWPSSRDDLLEEGLNLAARVPDRAAGTPGRRRTRPPAATECRDGRPLCAGIDPASASGCRRRLRCSAQTRRRRDAAG